MPAVSVRLCLALIQVQKEVSEVNEESSRGWFSHDANLFTICTLVHCSSFSHVRKFSHILSCNYTHVRKFSHIPSCNYPVFALAIWVYHLLHTYASVHSSFISPPTPFLLSNDIRHCIPVVLSRNMKYNPAVVSQHNLELWSWLHCCAAVEPNMLHKHSIALSLMFFSLLLQW